MPENLENSAAATGLEKVSFHSNPKERYAKECSNYRTIALISHASKVMLKILQARLQQCMNRELLLLGHLLASILQRAHTEENLDTVAVTHPKGNL